MAHGESSVSKPYKQITDVGICEARLFLKQKQHFDVMIKRTVNQRTFGLPVNV